MHDKSIEKMKVDVLDSGRVAQWANRSFACVYDNLAHSFHSVAFSLHHSCTLLTCSLNHGNEAFDTNPRLYIVLRESVFAFCYHYYCCFDTVAWLQVFLTSTDGGGDALWAGLRKRKWKQ